MIVVDVIISCLLFVFSQSRAKVSAVFTKVSDMALTPFDLACCSLSVVWFFFVLNISK